VVLVAAHWRASQRPPPHLSPAPTHSRPQDDGKENGDEENGPAPAQRHRDIRSPGTRQAALRPLSPGRAEALGVELADPAAAAAAGPKPAGGRTPKALKALFKVGWRAGGLGAGPLQARGAGAALGAALLHRCVISCAPDSSPSAVLQGDA
jgi:hypothetical protein